MKEMRREYENIATLMKITKRDQIPHLCRKIREPNEKPQTTFSFLEASCSPKEFQNKQNRNIAAKL